MTVSEFKNKIIDWVKTGFPKNIKSYNIRTLLQEISTKMPDVENYMNDKIYALGRNGNELKSVEINPVQFTVQSISESHQIQALKNLGINVIKIESNVFFLIKMPGNTGQSVQVGDVAVSGFNGNDFKKAIKFTGGNPALFTNWVDLSKTNNPVWIDIQNHDEIHYPVMNAGQVKIVKILEGSNIKEDGEATLGGSAGVKVGHFAMLVCMEDSTGGTQAEVGDKYAIVGNFAEKQFGAINFIYGVIADPNLETPIGAFTPGDYYIQTSDGTNLGDILSVWLYTGLETGDKFVNPYGSKGDPGVPGPKGEDGETGPQGNDGTSPHIGGNGNWFIGDTDTGVKASRNYKTIYDSEIVGLRNGVNTIFTTNDKYIPGTLKVYFNGSLLSRGNNSDFIEYNPGQVGNGAQIARVVTNKDLLIFEYEV